MNGCVYDDDNDFDAEVEFASSMRWGVFCGQKPNYTREVLNVKRKASDDRRKVRQWKFINANKKGTSDSVRDRHGKSSLGYLLMLTVLEIGGFNLIIN